MADSRPPALCLEPDGSAEHCGVRLTPQEAGLYELLLQGVVRRTTAETGSAVLARRLAAFDPPLWGDGASGRKIYSKLRQKLEDTPWPVVGGRGVYGFACDFSHNSESAGHAACAHCGCDPRAVARIKDELRGLLKRLELVAAAAARPEAELVGGRR